jgi:hypothetical protein
MTKKIEEIDNLFVSKVKDKREKSDKFEGHIEKKLYLKNNFQLWNIIKGSDYGLLLSFQLLSENIKNILGLLENDIKNDIVRLYKKSH